MVAKLTSLDKSMAKVYARRINRGETTIGEVPEKIRPLVEKLIEGTAQVQQ